MHQLKTLKIKEKKFIFDRLSFFQYWKYILIFLILKTITEKKLNTVPDMNWRLDVGKTHVKFSKRHVSLWFLQAI